MDRIMKYPLTARAIGNNLPPFWALCHVWSISLELRQDALHRCLAYVRMDDPERQKVNFISLPAVCQATRGRPKGGLPIRLATCSSVRSTVAPPLPWTFWATLRKRPLPFNPLDCLLSQIPWSRLSRPDTVYIDNMPDSPHSVDECCSWLYSRIGQMYVHICVETLGSVSSNCRLLEMCGMEDSDPVRACCPSQDFVQ